MADGIEAGERPVKTRGEMAVECLERAAQLCLHASDLMKLTDENGVVWAGPKAHQIGAVVDLLYAMASELDHERIDREARS